MAKYKKSKEKMNFGGFLKELGQMALDTNPLTKLVEGFAGKDLTKFEYNTDVGRIAKNVMDLTSGLSTSIGLSALTGGMISGLPQAPQEPPTKYKPVGENTSFKYGGKLYKAGGGYLEPLSGLTQQVNGHNPNVTDGVEIPGAYVDDGETISQMGTSQYVFSDSLLHPVTGMTFADMDRKIARSDKATQGKPGSDVEALNTLKYNNMLRQSLASANDAVRELKNLASGAYYKQGYQYGGPLPWEDFDVKDFQTYAGLKPDGIIGPKTRAAIANRDIMDKYAREFYGRIYDDRYKRYIRPEGLTARSSLRTSGMDLNNPVNPVQSGSNKLIARTMADLVEGKDVGLGPRFNLNGLSAFFRNPDPELGAEAQAPVLPVFTKESLRLSDVSSIAAPKSVQPTATTTNEIDKPSKLSKLLSNPMTYQFGELAAKATLLARGYDKQPYRVASSPVSLRAYDPTNALLQNQYSLNKARRDLSQLPTASGYLNNLQNVYANVARTSGDIVSRYDAMNRQAQVDYENRLAQREAQNIASRMTTDQIRQQDQAAYFNQLQDILTSVGNLGRAKADKQTNDRAVQMMLQAYPDIAKFFNMNLGG